MRLLPGPGLHPLLGGRHVDRVMQPAVPARRHLRCFRVTVVDHPTSLEMERRIDLAAAGAVIAIAELVGADELAIRPGPKLGAEGGRIPPGEEPQQKGLHRPLLPPGPRRVQAARCVTPRDLSAIATAPRAARGRARSL